MCVFIWNDQNTNLSNRLFFECFSYKLIFWSTVEKIRPNLVYFQKHKGVFCFLICIWKIKGINVIHGINKEDSFGILLKNTFMHTWLFIFIVFFFFFVFLKNHLLLLVHYLTITLQLFNILIKTATSWMYLILNMANLIVDGSFETTLLNSPMT